MTEVLIRAAYASVVEDDEDEMLFIGFAEGEDEEEPYCLFRQPLAGGPIWFEISSDEFGAEDAVANIQRDKKGITLHIAPAAQAQMGWASSIAVRIGPECEDAENALTALAEMFGPLYSVND